MVSSASHKHLVYSYLPLSDAELLPTLGVLGARHSGSINALTHVHGKTQAAVTALTLGLVDQGCYFLTSITVENISQSTRPPTSL